MEDCPSGLEFACSERVSRLAPQELFQSLVPSKKPFLIRLSEVAIDWDDYREDSSCGLAARCSGRGSIHGGSTLTAHGLRDCRYERVRVPVALSMTDIALTGAGRLPWNYRPNSVVAFRITMSSPITISIPLAEPLLHRDDFDRLAFDDVFAFFFQLPMGGFL